jgi:hypothetical protein
MRFSDSKNNPVVDSNHFLYRSIILQTSNMSRKSFVSHISAIFIHTKLEFTPSLERNVAPERDVIGREEGIGERHPSLVALVVIRPKDCAKGEACRSEPNIVEYTSQFSIVGVIRNKTNKKPKKNQKKKKKKITTLLPFQSSVKFVALSSPIGLLP